MGRFEGKVALITGGSRGIGKGVAEKFLEEGAKVGIIDINQEALNEAEQDFSQKGYDVFTKVASVTEVDQVKVAVEALVKQFGSVDILVKNAGVIRDNMLF